jgi:DNA-directed RNA polymerase beta subunit
LDMDDASEFAGATVQIGPEATTQGGYGYRQSATSVTVGTTNISFVNFVIGTSYVFDGGLMITGHDVQVALETTNPGLEIVSNKLGVKVDPAGTIVKNSGGIAVQVDAATIKINGSNQLQGLTPNKEIYTLLSGDITNQYINLAHLTVAHSLDFVVDGLVMLEGTDYTLSTQGGVTRITFAGDLATGGNSALIAGDVVQSKYLYL